MRSAADVMEMPRSCSISIQSEVTPLRSPLPCTAPAEEIAAACSASASVSVDLPASGWEMTAKVRRRAASSATSVPGRLEVPTTPFDVSALIPAARPATFVSWPRPDAARTTCAQDCAGLDRRGDPSQQFLTVEVVRVAGDQYVVPILLCDLSLVLFQHRPGRGPHEVPRLVETLPDLVLVGV